MRVEDLDHKELLQVDSEGGVIRFAGQRVLLLDAVAMGILRKYLIENFGFTAARGLLTQFGFAHGWRMAEAMQKEFNWDSEDDWRRAGARIHMLEGLFRFESVSKDPLSKEGAMLVASYEAEQHLLHFGRAEVPMCWTICGLISGYLSRTVGQEIFVLEDRCMGKGNAGCHLFGRTREEWGEDRTQELCFFQTKQLTDCLDISLQRVTETLKAAEKKLSEHRRALVRITHNLEEPPGMIAKSPAIRQLIDLAQRVAKVDATVLITGRADRARNGSHVFCTRNPPALQVHSLRSTAVPSPRRFWKGSCLAMHEVPLPVQRMTGQDCLKRRVEGLFFSTKSGRSLRVCRSNCYGFSKRGRSVVSERTEIAK